MRDRSRVATWWPVSTRLGLGRVAEAVSASQLVANGHHVAATVLPRRRLEGDRRSTERLEAWRRKDAPTGGSFSEDPLHLFAERTADPLELSGGTIVVPGDRQSGGSRYASSTSVRESRATRLTRVAKAAPFRIAADTNASWTASTRGSSYGRVGPAGPDG